MAELLVAITGASGAIYADRLLRKLVTLADRVHLVLTPQGAEMAARELDWAVDLDGLEISGAPAEVMERVRLYHPQDLSCRFASGSAPPDAMIIAPCTVGVAARIAAGLGDTLVSRAAAVCLKERRPLVLVVREAPLSLVDLRNLTALAEVGAIIVPASPAFYSRPDSIEELVDFFVLRVLDQVGLRGDHPARWTT